MIFLTFIIFLILIILLVSLITYFNSKNETNVVTEKRKIISEIKVNTTFDPTTYIGLQGKGVINWGDGTSESFDNQNTDALFHNYPSSGDYILTIEGEIISCELYGLQSSGGEGYFANILSYNIELINVEKLETLSVQFMQKDEGNEKYFLKGLESCEVLKKLFILDPQNIINLPSSNKLVNLRIFNSVENYITEINNLSSQVNLQTLRFRDIPTDVYTSDIFDTTIFSPLSELILSCKNSSLNNLILNNILYFLL